MTASVVLRCPFARAMVALSIPIVVAGCAHDQSSGGSAIDRTRLMCAYLSADGVESVVRDEEVWFWYRAERVDASRRMWNRGGIRALENRIAKTPEGRDRVCLERALREAHAKAIGYF